MDNGNRRNGSGNDNDDSNTTVNAEN